MAYSIKIIVFFSFFSVLNLFPGRILAEGNDNVVLENAQMKLVINSRGEAKSLLHKLSGQECLQMGTKIPVFSLTQFRPYANELQLKYPANPKTFAADSVILNGDNLIVTFELINITAIIKTKITDHYIAFTLEKLDHRIPGFGDKLKTSVDELVLLQLPVKDRDHFGELLNVVWDNNIAVNLLGTDPFVRIDAQRNEGWHLLRAQAVSEVKGEGTGAALITTSKDNLLNCIEKIEKDYNLPSGVESRRKPEYRYSYYEVQDVNPTNIDEHIAFAKKGGFKSIQIVWTAFASTIGHFPWNKEYPNGMKDLKKVVQKIKDAGMICGAHFWYNKAMKSDAYVSPVPDYRLNLIRDFTLAAPLDKNSEVIIVEENPEGCTLDNERRILKIGNELVQYTSYNKQRPYTFTGCKRGILHTLPAEYKPGYRFGLLDVDTWPIWIRFDQQTSIQDEVAQRIGQIYKDAGFQFVYFDGAEDIGQPYWFNTSMSQLKVYNSLIPSPLFSEGALKSHFSWHILTRGNAFDVFAPEVIKEATDKHPLDEINFVSNDFTSINFGWINYLAPDIKSIGMQPDMFEYVCGKAASWDCPISLEGKLEQLKSHARTADNLEVIRQWEEVRLKNLLTDEQKSALRIPKKEHILLMNENEKYELYPYEQISHAAKGNTACRAFIFNRENKTCVVFWHTSANGRIFLNLDPAQVHLYKNQRKEIKLVKSGKGVVAPLGERQYLETELKSDAVIKAFENAEIL